MKNLSIITIICFLTMGSLNAQYYLKSFAKRPQIEYWLDGAKSFPKKTTSDWHQTRSKKASINASFNYNKFKRAFPEIKTAMVYVSAAHFFKTNGPDYMLDKKMQNGDHVFYEESNNICVVYAPSGLPKTMFRPKEGMNYFSGLGGDNPSYTYEGANEKYTANSNNSTAGYGNLPSDCFKKEANGKYSKVDFTNDPYVDFQDEKIYVKDKGRYIQVAQDADGNGVLDNLKLFTKDKGKTILIPPGSAGDSHYKTANIFVRTSSGFKKIPQDLVLATEEYVSQAAQYDTPPADVAQYDTPPADAAQYDTPQPDVYQNSKADPRSGQYDDAPSLPANQSGTPEYDTVPSLPEKNSSHNRNNTKSNSQYGSVAEKSNLYEEVDQYDNILIKRDGRYVELTIRELNSPKFVPVPVYAEFNGEHFQVTQDADHDGYYDDFPLSILKADGSFEPVPPGYANEYEYRNKDFYYPGLGVMLRIPKPLVMSTERYAEDSTKKQLPSYGNVANARSNETPSTDIAQYDEPSTQGGNYDVPPAEAAQYDTPPADVAQYDAPSAQGGNYDAPPAQNENYDAPHAKYKKNGTSEFDPTRYLEYFGAVYGSEWHPINGQKWRTVYQGQWDAYKNTFRNLKSKEEYFAVALGFLHNAPKSTLSTRKKNGHTIKYHEASNLFAVYDERNRPITMFKPSNGIELYYEKTGTNQFTQGHYQAVDIQDDYQNIPIFQKRGSQYTKVPHRDLENGNYTSVPAYVKHNGKYVQIAKDKNHDDLYDNIPLFVKDRGQYVPVPEGEVFNNTYSNLPIFSKVNGIYVAIPPSLVKATEQYARAPARDQYTKAPARDQYTKAPARDQYTKAPAKGQYTKAPSPVYQKYGGNYKAVAHRDLKSGQYSPAPAYVLHNGKYIKVAADADHDGVFDDFQVFMKNRNNQYMPIPPGQVFSNQYKNLPIFKKINGQYLPIPPELVAGTEAYLGIGKN